MKETTMTPDEIQAQIAANERKVAALEEEVAYRERLVNDFYDAGDRIDARSIEHRPAGGAAGEWHPTPDQLPLAAIKALGARMERSNRIKSTEAADIVRQHGGRLPPHPGPAVMVKLLKVARAERRSRGVDAGPAAPKEFRRRRRITTDAEADAYVERTRHLRSRPSSKFSPPSPLVHDRLKKTRPKIVDHGSFLAFGDAHDRWCDEYVNACRRR